MKKAGITLHPEFKIGEISGRLFGAFLEPIGSMVNGSMYNPKHPEADEQGLRKDFYEALKETGLPAVRLPGGNFVSGWQWKDSIGPKEARKTHGKPIWTWRGSSIFRTTWAMTSTCSGRKRPERKQSIP